MNGGPAEIQQNKIEKNEGKGKRRWWGKREVVVAVSAEDDYHQHHVRLMGTGCHAERPDLI